MIRVCACFRIPARKTNRFGRCYGFQKKKTNQKVLGGNGTRCSQAVTHPSTDRARRCLTSVIGREPVLFNVVWPLPWCLGVIVGVKYIVFNIPMHEYEHQNAMRCDAFRFRMHLPSDDRRRTELTGNPTTTTTSRSNDKRDY
jgi:hypothetical protein